MCDLLEEWKRGFLGAAKDDQLEHFREHLQELGLPDEPEKLLHGTVLLVEACCAYACLDGQTYAEFLSMQNYCPTDSGDVSYALTFDLFGNAFGRILVPSSLRLIDLADLFGHPWWDYKVSGYSCFWVSRTDGSPLSDDESERIKNEITDDLRFDYSEDELGFWFDDSSVGGVLLVEVYHVEDFNQEDEDDD